MLDPKMEEALNRQINQELEAAHNYLAMCAYLDRTNLSGFATWMRIQRDEELEHAGRLVQYVLDRGGRVDLGAIDKPRADFQDVHDVFGKALEMEKSNTASINDLYRLAKDLNDFATQSHLQWFIDEQVEEEKIFDEVRALLEMAGNDKSALLMLNEKLGARKPDSE
jgi:ferritin